MVAINKCCQGFWFEFTQSMRSLYCRALWIKAWTKQHILSAPKGNVSLHSYYHLSQAAAALQGYCEALHPRHFQTHSWQFVATQAGFTIGITSSTPSLGFHHNSWIHSRLTEKLPKSYNCSSCRKKQAQSPSHRALGFNQYLVHCSQEATLHVSSSTKFTCIN